MKKFIVTLLLFLSVLSFILLGFTEEPKALITTCIAERLDVRSGIAAGVCLLLLGAGMFVHIKMKDDM